MNKPTVSRAVMERSARAIAEAGLPFQGFRLHPDGTVDALVGEPLTVESAKPESDEDEIQSWLRENG